MRHRLVRNRIALPVLAWALLLGLVPQVAGAVPLPPGPTTAGADPGVLETRLVVARLSALGLNAEEAQARLAALSDAERHELAQRLDEVDAGGSAAAALAIAIIVGLVVVLVLELLGRRVISRP